MLACCALISHVIMFHFVCLFYSRLWVVVIDWAQRQRRSRLMWQEAGDSPAAHKMWVTSLWLLKSVRRRENSYSDLYCVSRCMWCWSSGRLALVLIMESWGTTVIPGMLSSWRPSVEGELQIHSLIFGCFGSLQKFSLINRSYSSPSGQKSPNIFHCVLCTHHVWSSWY